MGIGWITVKQRLFAVVALDHVDGRGVFDLDAQKSLCDLGKPFYAAQPARHRASHPGTAGQQAVGPPPRTGRLCQPRPYLPGTDKEASGPLHVRNPFGWPRYGEFKFLTRERRQANRFQQRIFLLAEHTEEVDDLAIYVVVSLNRRGCAVEQDGSRATKRFTVMLTFRQKRQEPIQVAVFAAIPSESDEFAHAAIPRSEPS